MKKLLTIVLAIAFALTFAVMAVGCGDSVKGKDESGLLYKKNKGDDFYTVYGYNGEDVILDIGKIATEKGITIGKISKGAFSGNNTIKTLIVPTTVTEIGAGAFEKMGKLETITLPFFGKNANGEASFGQTEDTPDKATKEESIFGYIFGTESYEYGAKIINSYNGSAGNEYYIPYTLTKVILDAKENYVVPMYAFYGVTQINEVVLKNVKEIGKFAFAECGSIDKVTIPNTVTKIYDNAFECCEKLTNAGLTVESIAWLNSVIGDSVNVFENTGVEIDK